MSYFLWTADLITRDKRVDADHRKLTMLIDGLFAAFERGASVGTINLEMDNLLAFAKEHFDWEESEMLRIGFVDRDRHAADHSKLMMEVTVLKSQIESAQHIKLLEIYDFMRTWLRNHILCFDTPFIVAAAAFGCDQPSL